MSLLILSLVRQQTETNVPADILLIEGTCIVNEAMLSGESTPLLKESIALLEGSERLDIDGIHKGAVLFSGTKLLQASPGGSFSIFFIAKMPLKHRAQARLQTVVLSVLSCALVSARRRVS